MKRAFKGGFLEGESLTLNKVAGGRPIKKETPTQCFLRTLPEDCSE